MYLSYHFDVIKVSGPAYFFEQWFSLNFKGKLWRKYPALVQSMKNHIISPLLFRMLQSNGLRSGPCHPVYFQ